MDDFSVMLVLILLMSVKAGDECDESDAVLGCYELPCRRACPSRLSVVILLERAGPLRVRENAGRQTTGVQPVFSKRMWDDKQPRGS